MKDAEKERDGWVEAGGEGAQGEREREEEREWLCLGKGVTVETQSTLYFWMLDFCCRKIQRGLICFTSLSSCYPEATGLSLCPLYLEWCSPSIPRVHTRDGFREKTRMEMSKWWERKGRKNRQGKGRRETNSSLLWTCVCP